MAHNQNIRVHRIERSGRIEQRLAFFNRAGRDLHRDDIGPKALTCQLERLFRPRRVLKKQVDERLAAQGAAVWVLLHAQIQIMIAKG